MVLAIVVGAIGAGLLIWATVVCVQKGKGMLLLFALLVGGWVVVFVGAIRLAKPTSRWAVKRYNGEKMARAVERFADEADVLVAQEDRATIETAWGQDDVDTNELDPITRRALRKAGRI